MDMVINKLNLMEDDFLNVISDSFIVNGHLYNASYVPGENITIMLEEVIRYDSPAIYYKDGINMILVKVNDRTSVSIESPFKEITTKDIDIATAAATSAFKLGLTYSDLSVTVSDGCIDIML